MAKYEIRSFRGGISDYEDKGIEGAFKFGSNLDIRKTVDSLSCNQALMDEGLHSSHSSSRSPSPSASSSRSPSRSVSASPSPTPSPSASVSPSASPSGSASRTPSASPSPSSVQPTIFEDLILKFVECTDGYTYGFGDKGHIYRRDQDGFWMHMYKDPGGRISAAYEWPSVNKKKYLYWATSLTLNRKEIPGRNDWTDVNAGNWQKTNLTPADWHSMRECGGSLIIANGPFLALVGYDESYTNEALDLIPGNIAKTIVERNGRTIAGTVRASDGVGVNAAIDSEFPLAQIGTDGELFYASMTNSVSIKRFPGGGIVNPGGVINQSAQANFFEWEQIALSWIDKNSVGNLSLWGVYGAEEGKNGVYSYGHKNKNHPTTMNLEYALEVDQIGALGMAGTKLLVSYQEGTTYGVKTPDPNNKAIGVYEGLDFKSPIKEIVDVTTWKTIQLLHRPLPNGAKIEFWYRMNKEDTDFVKAKTADGYDQKTKANSRKTEFRIGAAADIYEPRLVLYPFGNSSPEVFRARTYFE